MHSVGIDVGSVSTKAVIYDGKNYDYIILPTGWSPKEAGLKALKELCNKKNIKNSESIKIIGTGYGRVNMPYAQKTVSEIACHGKGAHFLFSDATGVIDVGGQDSKAMILDENGKVTDFVLNDKCAAGTGRFLQVTAQALGVDINDIDYLAEGVMPVEIGSMCTVFAESEVISLLAQGKVKNEIISGVIRSIAKKIVAMAGRVNLGSKIVFTGGMAKSKLLKEMLVEISGWDISTPDNPQIVGALGAAVLGYELIEKGL